MSVSSVKDMGAPVPLHNLVIANFNAIVNIQLMKRNSRCRSIPGASFKWEGIDLEIIPDATIFCDPNELRKKSALKGVPRFVMEVLSPSTAKNDRTIKKEIYRKVGIPEYWLIKWDMDEVGKNNRTLEIYVLNVKSDGDTEYALHKRITDDNADELISLVTIPYLKIRFEELFSFPS